MNNKLTLLITKKSFVSYSTKLKHLAKQYDSIVDTESIKISCVSCTYVYLHMRNNYRKYDYELKV